METPKPMEIKEYVTHTGKAPFREWLNRLRDLRAKVKILQRLDRLTLGHFGDTKYLREGIYELRISEGKGYRIYYSKEAETIVLLLCGGDKHSQLKDIQTALTYWQNYQRGD